MSYKTKQLEKIVRGFSNHRRIEILMFLEHKPNLSVLQISYDLGVNFKTISEHLRRLAVVGLVEKKNLGPEVVNKLAPLGNSVLKFLKNLN